MTRARRVAGLLAVVACAACGCSRAADEWLGVWELDVRGTADRNLADVAPEKREQYVGWVSRLRGARLTIDPAGTAHVPRWGGFVGESFTWTRSGRTLLLKAGAGSTDTIRLLPSGRLEWTRFAAPDRPRVVLVLRRV